jgi:hypothetical protein
MDLRTVTPEVVISSASSAAGHRMAFLGKGHFGPFLSGPDSRHQPRNTGTDAQDIGFDPFFFHVLLHHFVEGFFL